MNGQVIGHRVFTDGVTHLVYQDERGQYIEEDGQRIDARWPPLELGASVHIDRGVSEPKRARSWGGKRQPPNTAMR
jgi:hypothetical protein